jgi:hypothetical protein
MVELEHAFRVYSLEFDSAGDTALESSESVWLSAHRLKIRADCGWQIILT